MAAEKKTLASKIYANMKNAHPEWSNKRLYTATRWALEQRGKKAEAPAEVPAEA